MRNREVILKNLDSIESNLRVLNSTVKRGDKEGYEISLERIQTLVENIKSYIESEPISGRELNQF